jgi:hypothetical protein
MAATTRSRIAWTTVDSAPVTTGPASCLTRRARVGVASATSATSPVTTTTPAVERPSEKSTPGTNRTVTKNAPADAASARIGIMRG